MNPKTLIILRGIPGSGKSTIAGLLGTIPGAVTVSADDFPGRYDYDEQGSVQINLAKLQDGLDWCYNQTLYHVRNQVPVIVVHNTFLKKDQVLKYFDLGQDHGYRVLVMKAENRFVSDHNVPGDIIEQMRQEYEAWDGPFSDSTKQAQRGKGKGESWRSEKGKKKEKKASKSKGRKPGKR